jgi:glycyl-tRNA synthetase beta chain
MADFLFEVGLEEIPARMIAPAQAELARRAEELLVRERLLDSGHAVVSYSTPRRLAVHVKGVLPRQADAEEQLTGPSWKVAFKEEQPTPAAIAFAKKAGVEVSALRKLETPKGEYVGATVHRPGRDAAQVLAEQLQKELAGIYWAKNMYWRSGKPERFVRPLRWLLALLDDQIVPVEFAGIRAGKLTFGHRILHGEAPVSISEPSAYVPALAAVHVMADVEVRRQKIRKDLDRVTRSVPGARWREDHPLIDTVTHLTEWPSVLLGNFDREYLTLPEEVLVTVMRDHQKYFAVEDAQGKLAPHFLAVLNTEPDETGTALVRQGNERVLRARFNDARFFWNADQKLSLEDRVEMLKAVTFQKDLGSYYDKTEANVRTSAALATLLAAAGVGVDPQALSTTARLAKTDLTTDLVKEFTELQGLVGGLYARAQGHGEKVAQAIYWQYSPASTDDPVPPTIEGQILGLADRMNTIVDMFAIGLEPTGSKDPFALRRAANGVVKILAESGLPLTLTQASAMATTESKFGQTAKTQDEIAAMVGEVEYFLSERLEFYLKDVSGIAYDVVKATLAAGADDVRDAMARAEALSAVRGSEDFAAISAAFKRIKNILRQAAEKQDSEAAPAAVDSSLFADAEEVALHARSLELVPRVEAFRQKQQYREALELIATLRPHVDLFFDKVMVMSPDRLLRRNRLALISSVLENFSRIADFSEIVTGP